MPGSCLCGSHWGWRAKLQGQLVNVHACVAGAGPARSPRSTSTVPRSLRRVAISGGRHRKRSCECPAAVMAVAVRQRRPRDVSRGLAAGPPGGQTSSILLLSPPGTTVSNSTEIRRREPSFANRDRVRHAGRQRDIADVQRSSGARGGCRERNLTCPQGGRPGATLWGPRPPSSAAALTNHIRMGRRIGPPSLPSKSPS